MFRKSNPQLIKDFTSQSLKQNELAVFYLGVSGVIARTVFHGGDSGYVPLKDYASDEAFLQVGRMSPTASPENAFKMATDIKPKVAVAIHGSEKQKLEFQNKIQESMPQTSVLIMEQFTTKTISLSNVS